MKWLVLADLQGFEYQQWQVFLGRDFTDVQAVITLGDIDFLHLQSLKRRFHDKPFYGVLGNHDEKGDLEFLNISNLHNAVTDITGLKVAGLEGCVRYKKGNDPMYKQKEMDLICQELPVADIVCSHNSPYGVHDKPDMAHEGYTGLRNYLFAKKPLAVLHGHQHQNRITQVGETFVISVYGGWLWELTTNTWEQVLKVVE